MTRDSRTDDQARPVVLIVDDDPDTRDLYCQYLAAYGFECRQARNGMEAFTKARENAPDILVTDLAMPTLEGSELIHRLGTDEATQRIPVIVLTGRDLGSTQFPPSFKSAALLTKPCLPEHLLQEIRRVLGRSGE
jgi:two-component system, cell cycle response regulator DivK